MANLTLSIDDELLKAARRIALEQDSSVNQLVREFLEQLTATESRKKEAKQRLLSTSFEYEPAPFDRESLYER